MSGRGPHPDQDQEDSMSDIESNEEIAWLGMLNISSSPDEALMVSHFDPTSPQPKHSLVTGPVTRSQAKKVPDKRSRSASPRRHTHEFHLAARRTPNKFPRARNPTYEGKPLKSVTRRLLMEDDMATSTHDTPPGRHTQPNYPIDSIASLPGASNMVADSSSPAGSSSIHVTPPAHDSSLFLLIILVQVYTATLNMIDHLHW